ncbi:MAG: glycosyltransferase, partial [Patescibacteria group bacterium]
MNNLHFYGETHRIMSVITYLHRPKYIEIPVHHRPRKFGSSNYGYERIFKLIIDLITLKFLYNYGTKPAYLFGTIGLITYILG